MYFISLRKQLLFGQLLSNVFFTARQHVVKNVIEVRNIVLEREFDFIQH